MSAFLVRSHQAVARHCETLLSAGGLSKEQEQKLTRLAREAELEIERLTARRLAA